MNRPAVDTIFFRRMILRLLPLARGTFTTSMPLLFPKSNAELDARKSQTGRNRVDGRLLRDAPTDLVR
jgi:hypothetical protein